MNVVVIAAHPDDETLGVGGTMLKHISNQDNVYWLIATNMLESEGFSPEQINKRQDEIDRAGKMLGVSGIEKLNFASMSLTDNSLNELIPKISQYFNHVKPDVIYVMNRSDAHSDHRILFDAVMACTKSFRYPFIKKVLMYECISETEFAPALPEKAFIPNYYVDITGFLNKKLEIMEIYESEVSEHPFPRSLRNITALATFRGASVGVEYAEAFQLIKFIDKN
jgi:LmbE family N-acetylglucosaminyl deacetylase